MYIGLYPIRPAYPFSLDKRPRFQGKVDAAPLELSRYGPQERALKEALEAFQKARESGIQSVRVENHPGLGKRLILTMGDGYEYCMAAPSYIKGCVELMRLQAQIPLCETSLELTYSHSPCPRDSENSEDVDFSGCIGKKSFNNILQQRTFKKGNYPYPTLLKEVEAFVSAFGQEIKAFMQRHSIEA